MLIAKISIKKFYTYFNNGSINKNLEKKFHYNLLELQD